MTNVRGESDVSRIRPWDRILLYRKEQRNGGMRGACLGMDPDLEIPVEHQPSASSSSRVFQARYRLPSLGYPVFDADADPRERFDHLFHRCLVREREQDRGCGQKGVKAPIMLKSRFRGRVAHRSLGWTQENPCQKVTFQFSSLDI